MDNSIVNSLGTALNRLSKTKQNEIIRLFNKCCYSDGSYNYLLTSPLGVTTGSEAIIREDCSSSEESESSALLTPSP
jgi:hypothetical protein